ncbi:hypothetical protein A6A06_38990 [Streptomyces sp. CB02923]|uniref:alpha/beta fold hydrolase n=1 Tax=Streptomyces sp. CB02923 TaxID=1718985 RepID=UPI00093E80F0|nr:alpha/beta hydrolase [Streptomyces sp. CB02923]OKI03523.1 hypothetical protein A6A06_38990 [Streptomyces sp. CB02923]
MPVVSVHGTPVHYTAEGTGPGLLLVHAAGMDSETAFGELRGEFTGRHTVITPDFSGSGKTPVGEGPLTVGRLAGQVVGAACDVTDEPFDVVGFSLGAVVAAAAAADHPGRVRRLVLVCGWYRGDDPRQRVQMDLWQRLATLDEEAYAQFTALMVFSPRYLSEVGADGIRAGMDLITVETGLRRQMELVAAADLRDRIASVAAPTLVVGAAHDHWIPVEHARATHRAITASRYAEIDSGHLAIFEKPRELCGLVKDFIEE